MEMMRSDPIVGEMRAHAPEIAAKHGNDLRCMCDALRDPETVYGCQVVHREPRRLERMAAS